MKAAFITTIASAAVMTAGLGCESEVTVTCVGEECGSGGSTASGCPEQVPADEASCGDERIRCEYLDDDPCKESYIAECGLNQTWNVVAEWVKCTEPTCPQEMPGGGQSCDAPDTEVCDYEDGICPVEARCIDGTWALSGPTCNPPPP